MVGASHGGSASPELNVVSYLDLIIVDITRPQSPKVIKRTGGPDWPDLDFLEIEGAGVFLHDSVYPTPDPITGLPPAGDGHVAVPNATGDIVILGDEDFSKFDTVLDTSAGAFAIGIALFGPDPIANFPAGDDIIDTGSNGCAAASIPPAGGPGEIALIERGACFFSTKAASAQAQGYDAYIVYNNTGGGNSLINMSSGTADGHQQRNHQPLQRRGLPQDA